MPRTIRDLPVAPNATRFAGHFGALRQDRLAFAASMIEGVPRLSRYQSPIAEGLLVNHPEVLQELFVDQGRDWVKTGVTRFSLAPIGGEGLFTSNGELWKKQRRIMAPLFQPAQLKTYAADMVDCARRGVADWKDGEQLELARETTRITMSVAGKTLFDADTFSEADSLGEALTIALDWAAANAPSPLALAHVVTSRILIDAGRGLAATRRFGERAHRWGERIEALGRRAQEPVFVPGEEGRKLRAAVAVLDERVQRMIEDRRAGKTVHNDLLSRLLDSRDEDGSPMPDKQVRDEILTLFVAGHETTASALAWSMQCLCANPDVYAAVEREVDALAGDPTEADLPKLDLCLRVFKEALRLYPPVYLIGRQARVDTEIDGVAVARHTVALSSPYALHRRKDIWPDPEKFDPERFRRENEAKRHRLAWMPFGAGPRVCIGNHFAMMEGPLVLAVMMRHARFEQDRPDEPAPTATLRPKNGMPMRVRLRKKNSREAA